MSENAPGEGQTPPKEAAPAQAIEPPAKEVQNALKKLSESKPQAIMEMMAIAGTMGNPLHSKMEAQHITQVLTLASEHDEREFEIIKTKEANSATDRASIRRYVFATFIVVICLIVMVLITFKSQRRFLLRSFLESEAWRPVFLPDLG